MPTLSIPRIIHFCVPADPSPKQLAAVAIAGRLHPKWRVVVWRDPVAVDGFRLARYWNAVGSGAQRADLIRIEALLRFGGVYLDSDVILHHPLDPIAANCRFFIASEDGRVATNAVFGAVPNHPALQEMVEELLLHPPNWEQSPVDTTGPWFFTRMLEGRADVSVLPRETFYPFNYNEPQRAPHPFSYGTHLWEGSWKPAITPVTWAASNWRSSVDPRRIADKLVWQVWKRARFNENVAVLSAPARRLRRAVSRRGAASDRVRMQAPAGHAPVSLFGTCARDASRAEIFVQRLLRGGDCVIDVAPQAEPFGPFAASILGRFGNVHSYAPERLAADHWAATRAVAKAGLPIAAGLAANATVLDTEFPYDLPIKLLRIDAPGGTAGVLRGARRLIEHHCIDSVVIESAPPNVRHPEYPNQLNTLLACDYSLHRIGRHGLPSDAGSRVLGDQWRTPNRILLLSPFARSCWRQPRWSVSGRDLPSTGSR